jgi:hypothetical protein
MATRFTSSNEPDDDDSRNAPLTLATRQAGAERMAGDVDPWRDGFDLGDQLVVPLEPFAQTDDGGWRGWVACGIPALEDAPGAQCPDD